LQAAAIQTLSVIEKSGWATAFKLPEEQTQAEKVKVLQRAAASVASPTKPWWFNE
jgi:hypothetical protein